MTRRRSLCENMTSSTKQEVHNIAKLPEEDRATAENFGKVMPCGFRVTRADRQTDRQTDRQANSHTVLITILRNPSGGEVTSTSGMQFQ